MRAPKSDTESAGTNRASTLSTRSSDLQPGSTTIMSRSGISRIMSVVLSLKYVKAAGKTDQAEDCRTPHQHPRIDRFPKNDVPDDLSDIDGLGQGVIETAHHVARDLGTQQLRNRVMV